MRAGDSGCLSLPAEELQDDPPIRHVGRRRLRRHRGSCPAHHQGTGVEVRAAGRKRSGTRPEGRARVVELTRLGLDGSRSARDHRGCPPFLPPRLTWVSQSRPVQPATRTRRVSTSPVTCAANWSGAGVPVWARCGARRVDLELLLRCMLLQPHSKPSTVCRGLEIVAGSYFTAVIDGCWPSRRLNTWIVPGLRRNRPLSGPPSAVRSAPLRRSRLCQPS